MKHLDLLGTPIKSEFLFDLLETYDVQVVYEYDRTHENLPDQYHGEIPDLGLQFVFDENQILRTLFVTPVEITTFNPFEDDERVRMFASKSEARQHAKDNDVPTSEGEADFMGEHRDWIRFECVSYSVHYEYVDSALKMITLQTTNV
nr:putative integron gene cassette protein [uncultured bacterium]